MQVLHLADVLHNTPNHPLCVKALQRRAAAYQVRLRRHATCKRLRPFLISHHIPCTQALGQHSMAMADLQAAADMVPGDAEVG
jgi:hypothetical protein